MKFTGIDKALRNLNREVAKIKGKTSLGLRAAALHVKGKALEITPKKTGHLQNSAYVTVIATTRYTAAEIGYTAAYAPFVHEVERVYHSENPKGQWKFLETAMKTEADEVIKIISALSRFA